MRRVVFPPATSVSDPTKNGQQPKWGLVEFIVERALSNPDLLATVENCTRVMSLLPRFRDMIGPEQSGKAIVLSDSDYEFVGWALRLALQNGAKEAGGMLPIHLVIDFAGYMRAFHTAEVVSEALPAEATAPLSSGGVA